MGLTAQSATVDELLTGRENLWLIGEPLRPRPRTIDRVGDELLERFSLDRGRATGSSRPTPAACGAASTSRSAWSPRRPCSSSTSRPPASTRAAGSSCGTCCATSSRDGTTLLLTTQYLDEADQLADDIVVVDRGKVIAAGHAARAQGRRPARPRLVVTVSRADDLAAAVERWCAAPVGEVHVDGDGPPDHRAGRGAGRRHPDRRASSTRAASSSTTSGLQRPSLDDVFLNLTGHRAEEAETPTTRTSHEDQEVARMSHDRRTARIERPEIRHTALLAPVVRRSSGATSSTSSGCRRCCSTSPSSR